MVDVDCRNFNIIICTWSNRIHATNRMPTVTVNKLSYCRVIDWIKLLQ